MKKPGSRRSRPELREQHVWDLTASGAAASAHEGASCCCLSPSPEVPFYSCGHHDSRKHVELDIRHISIVRFVAFFVKNLDVGLIDEVK
jgi:hypothetical protein